MKQSERMTSEVVWESLSGTDVIGCALPLHPFQNQIKFMNVDKPVLTDIGEGRLYRIILCTFK